MFVEIDGKKIHSESEFHDAIADALKLSSHYGKNLDALWDVLSSDVGRPLQLVWNHSSLSRAAMPERFEMLLDLLRRVQQQDMDWDLPEKERFDFFLR